MVKKKQSKKSNKVVLVTGGFDPIHSGHIAYFESARKLGDCLVVGMNSDSWLIRKKGKFFMPSSERTEIIRALKPVDHVILFDDTDNTAIQAIANCKELFPDSKIIFANGGDRTKKNIPEMVFDDVEYKFGVGGRDKKNSSSWILKDWEAPRTDRPWGYYRVFHEHGVTVKVKELVIYPGKKLSMQKHEQRTEQWVVSQGTIHVNSIGDDGKPDTTEILSEHQDIRIDEGQWHQIENKGTREAKVIEIQYGEMCIESDIERIGVPDDY